MSGDTALHYAVQEEHAQITELLLDYGASTEIENYKKEYAEFWSSQLGIGGDFDVKEEKEK